MFEGAVADELLEELAQKEGGGPPTLLVSASSGAPAVAERFGIELVAKPFHIDDLVSAVERTAARPHRVRATAG